MATHWPTKLAALSLSGQVLLFVLGVVLARQLGVDGFESYVVAAAAFTVMVTLVPQGLDKYSLKLIPPLLDGSDFRTVRAYLAFAGRRTMIASVLVGIPVATLAWHAGTSGPKRASR
jgi:O-antigen/teichoic acid export membrane protein